MDDKNEIIKYVKNKGLVKGYKKIQNSHINILDIKKELKYICNIYISEGRYNELLSFVYITDNVLDLNILLLLRKLFAKKDYPSFLKQAYRFKLIFELKEEIYRAIQWHLDNNLPDGNAWKDKFDNLFLELKIKDKSSGNDCIKLLSNNNYNEKQNMKLTENKSYRFNVIRIEEAKDNQYYVIDVNNKEVWVKLFDYQKSRANLKKQICCVFCGFDKYGSYIFVQDKLSILNDLYEENLEYKFKFISESFDNNTNASYSIIMDEYGISHRLYDTLSENQKCGKEEIICIVDNIDPIKKILRLKLKKSPVKDNETDFSGTWFDADRVFSDIHREDMKRNFFEPLLSSEDKNPYLVSMKKNYLSKNNLWIFSLLNYIDNVMIKELSSQDNYVDLELYTELVIDLQKWILEDSDFLEFFSGERKEETKIKSETQLIKYDAQLKAINLIKENKQEEFIEDILSSLRKSKRIVWRRNDRIQILLRLLSLDLNILQHDIDSFIELVMLLSEGEDLLDEFNRNVLNNVLSWRISTENAQLNQIMHYESEDNVLAKKQTVINIIRVIGSQVILAKYDENISRIKRSQFFRYMCLISEKDNHKLFLNLSIDSLLGMRGYENLFKWDIVLNFNINEIIEKSKKITPTLSHNDVEMYLSSRKGNIYNYEGRLIIIPNSLFDASQSFSVENIKTLHGILDGKVSIGSFYTVNELVSEGNILEIYNSWNSIIKGRSINGLCKGKIEIGDIVRVVVKKQSQNDNLKSLLFVSIINRKTKIESCIHITQISSKYISDARNLFAEGDIIDAQVLRVKENGNIELTLRPFTEKFSNAKTTVEEDLKSLVIGNINNCGNEFKPITKELLTELIYTFDMYIKVESDILNKFFYIMYNRLLTGMLKINSKTSFYTFILYYNIALYEFIQSVNGITTIEYKEWYTIVCNKYPELENKRIVFKLIESINNPALIEETELNSIVQCDNIYVSKIARLVLMLRYLNNFDGTYEAFVSVKKVLNNVLSEQNEFINIDIEEVRRNSLDSLKNEALTDESEEDDIIDSYGYENQTTEFKTSYIYYAVNSEVKLHEQSEVIMKVICGFLNADGGKILIGVDDNGLPVGILNDLKYLNENKDEYERRIRKNIVESFSKDINGLISIEFDRNNVCIISVPSYHRPVALNKNFWQRQGNETRIITGEDLIPFILRRSSAKENKVSYIESKNDYNSSMFNSKHMENQKDQNVKTLAFWNLFKDGSYIVMDTEINSKDILQSIPITNEMKKGYILQCYNNGCINKYPIKNILDKKKGFKYINGLYLYASIKMISIIADDLYLIVKSEYNNETYIKIYNSSNISLHTSLNLKGNQVVDNLGDNISYYILPNNKIDKLKKLLYNSPTGIGKNIENQYYLEEKNTLIELGVIKKI